ncbi:protein sprouty homolog 2 [Betta splendens]|uniref:Protein sprouty homolog 2 n=1 Tax=Betta splendens TaxID=158456 RepID=A0A6P7LWR5_BETSP|nr:protein sprouty homolog 2 [Betta splendens]
MDSRSQSDSDGGGGRSGGPPPPSTGPAGPPPDEGRTQTPDGPPDPGLNNGHLPHALAVLSLGQIRITGSSNEYTEGPTVARRSPASQHRLQDSDSVTSPALSRTSGLEVGEEQPDDPSDPHAATRHAGAHVTVSSGVEDSQSSIRTSVGSSSSGYRLLGSLADGDRAVRSQPKGAELSLEELKPLSPSEPRAVAAVPGRGDRKAHGKHSDKCASCGRCRCPECARPRALPSCWMCGRRCVCSAQSAAEYATCVCCVKGLFYHCSSDDEDTCADKPFSCAQGRCCARWAAVSLLSLLFPCLLCYLPAKGCVAACQSAYDRASRPGCRCRGAGGKRA